MADLGDLLARLLLDSSQWTAGMKQAETETANSSSKISSSLSSMSEALGNVGKALAGLAVASALKGFAEDAMAASGELGKFKSAMVALKGNGDDTAAFLERIHQISATSPFAFPELSGAAQRMVQLGGSMSQVSDTMTAITQMGTALKMSGEQVTGIATAMGKLAAGSDPLRVMKQLVGESVPAWEMLAQELGTNMADAQAKVKSGAVSNDEIIKLLTHSMGQYADSAAGWSSGWKGAMKGLSSEVDLAMAAIGNDMKAALNDIGAPAIKAVTELVKDAATWWKNLSPPVKDAILAFGGAVGTFAAVGGALGTLSLAIGAIGAPIALAVLGIAAVVAALVALGVWVHEHWDGISKILTETWNGIKEIWGQAWNETITAITGSWNEFIANTKTEWNDIVGVVTAVWNGVTAVCKGAWEGIWAAVKFVWESVKTSLQIWDTILSYLLPFWDPIKQAFLAVWNEIVSTITGAWAKIKGVFDSATGSNSWIGKVASTFGLVSKAVTDVGTEMGKTVPKTAEVTDAHKTLNGHLKDNHEQLGKVSAAHQDVQDKYKATKEKTQVLWAESQILNGEFQKQVQYVANVKVEMGKLEAQGKTLADAVTSIAIPTITATAELKHLEEEATKAGAAIGKTTGGLTTSITLAEAAMKDIGATSTRVAQNIADKTAADKAQVQATGDMMSKYDNLMQTQANLKAQIEALIRTDGDHKDKLGELQQALKDTTTEIDNMATSTTEAYHNLGLNTTQDIQKIIDKDEERWAASKKLADDGNPAMIKQMHEAELQMLKDYDQYGLDLSTSQKQRMEDLEKELGKHHDTQKEAWKQFEKDVKKDFEDTFSAMEDMLITGDGSFHDIMTKLWQSLAKDALDLFLAPLKKGIEDFIATTLKSLLSGDGLGGISTALGNIGKSIGGIFGGGGGGYQTTSAAGGLPGVGDVFGKAGSSVTSAGSKVVGAGLSSVVGMATGIVSAASSVISNFQQAKMETTMNAVEHNTRYTMMYVGERADGGILGILFKIDEEIAWGANTKATENLRDLFKDWSNPALAALEGIKNGLDGIAPYIVDTKTVLEDIRTLASDLKDTVQRGFETLNVTVTATGVTTAEAAKLLGDQIARNLATQLVAIKA